MCAERQTSTYANKTSCSAYYELFLLARLPLYCSAECATPTNTSFLCKFPEEFGHSPFPPESFRTCFVCATHAHSHFCPQHWPLCHLGLYKFEFDFALFTFFTGIRSRLALKVEGLARVSKNAGGRPRLATVAFDGRYMGLAL